MQGTTFMGCDAGVLSTRKKPLYKSYHYLFSTFTYTLFTENSECATCYNNLLSKAKRGLRFYGKSKEQIIELIRKVAVTADLEQFGYFSLVFNIIIAMTKI
jgi:hypothetical protein